MTPENQSKLLEAYDETFQKLGLNLKNGMKQVCDAMEHHLRKLKQIRSRHSLQAMLAREPELSPSQLSAHIAAIRLLPYQLRKLLPVATKEAVKNIPHSPGGRPAVFTPDDCLDICAQIGALIGRGVRLKQAQERLSAQKGVSLRTIQRVWQNRLKHGAIMES
jgi:hypothetical protein